MSALLASLTLLLAAAYSGAQQNPCHGNNLTYVGHSTACDQYYACDFDGTPSPVRTCPNGMAFYQDPANINEADYCIFHNRVDCQGLGLTLAEPITVGFCEYLNGYFPDPAACDVYYLCEEGEATRYQCGPGLAYDTSSGICDWADKVASCAAQRETALVQSGFVCPDVLPGTSGSFTRHPHPEDCRQYFVCFDLVPREYGCPIGTVFQIGSLDGQGNCASPDQVPGCEDYYGEVDVAAIQLAALQ